MASYTLAVSGEQIMKKDKNEQEYYVLDVFGILSLLWKRLWVIILSGIIAAAVAFSYSNFLITPRYSARIMLYVNNSSFSVGSTSFSISSSEISAAQSLVKTYIVVLNNRTTLEEVIQNTGVSYTYEQLSGMIDAAPINSTEVFAVRVTSTNPYEAVKIANGIAEVLPERVADIIEGASMRLVDKAVVNLNKVYPSITKYTAAGFVVGALIAAIIIVIIGLKDDSIHDDDYILNNYDFPILAKIPDINDGSEKHYGYYSYRSHKSRDSSSGNSEGR